MNDLEKNVAGSLALKELPATSATQSQNRLKEIAETLDFLRKFESLDALTLFYSLDAIRQDRSTLFSITITEIVIELEKLGATTAKGRFFTYSTTLNRLRELERSNVISLEEVESGSYSIELLLDVHSLDVASSVDAPRARDNIDNNNIKINKQNTRTREKALSSPSSSLDKRASEEVEEVDTQKETVDDLVARVDLQSEEARRLRASIVLEGWERGLNKGLVDRAVAAILLKIPGATLSSIKAAIQKARETLARRKSGSNCGRRLTLWWGWCLDVKRIFDEYGALWTPTTIDSEPSPRRVELFGISEQFPTSSKLVETRPAVDGLAWLHETDLYKKLCGSV